MTRYTAKKHAIRQYPGLPMAADRGMDALAAMMVLAVAPFLGVCAGLFFAAQFTYSAMRRVRLAKQKEAKQRYLEKLREQSR